SRISGPLMDRIDIAIEVPEVNTLDMLAAPAGEPSEKVAARVEKARARQAFRYKDLGLPIRTNAELSGEALRDIAAPDDKGAKLLEDATRTLKLSMRGYTRVLRVARTIADLEGSDY